MILTNVIPRITNLVNQLLRLKNLPANQLSILPDDPLIDAGLSSTDVVKLVFLVEAEFQLEFQSNVISPAHFHCIQSIANLIQHLDHPQSTTTTIIDRRS